jgi:hypothetical protein
MLISEPFWMEKTSLGGNADVVLGLQLETRQPLAIYDQPGQ